MSSVYFDPAVGGDGSTVSDDSNSSTGLASGGHRTRFVPALSQVVSLANFAKGRATAADASAIAAAGSATIAEEQAAMASDAASDAAISSGLAQTKAGEAVDSADSASSSAIAAAASAASIAGGPVANINGQTGAVVLDSLNAGAVLVTAQALPSPAWLPCDGQAYLQSSYPDLFAEIGTIPKDTTDFVWTVRTVNIAINSIAYNGSSLFVAVGEGAVLGGILSSADGTSWGSQSWGYNLNGVAYGNGVFVVVGDGGRIFTVDSNGTATSRTSGVVTDLVSVAFGNGVFVAVPNSSTGTVYLTSPDGATWTTRTKLSAYSPIVRFVNGYFVIAMGANYGLMYSANPVSGFILVTGAVMQLSATVTFGDIAYGNGVYVASTSSGMAVSADLTKNWKIIPGLAVYSVVEYLPTLGRFMGAYYGASIAYLGTSFDGEDWSMCTPSLTSGATKAICEGAGMVLHGSSALHIRTTPTFGYDTSTTFITPKIPTDSGVKAFIKTGV